MDLLLLLQQLQFPSLPLFLSSVLFVLLIVRSVAAFRSKRVKLPPGPWRMPLLGNLHQIAGSPLVHRRLRDLAAEYGPLMFLRLGQVPVAVVSSPELAQVVMKTKDHDFASRPSILATKIISYDGTGIVFTPYGEYWRQARKICTIELFSHSRVQSFRPIREQEVRDFVRDIRSCSGETINLTKKIFSLTFGITGRAAFGKKSKDQEVYMSLVTQMVPLLTGFSLADLFPSSRLVQAITETKGKLERIHEQQDAFFQNIMNEHREKTDATGAGVETGGGEDLVDVLLRLQKSLEFPLTDDNIKAIITDVFSAGSESSSTTIEWAMAELMRNPEMMKKAQWEVREAFGTEGDVEEMNLHKLRYLQAVIKETLRLHPPAPLLVPRETQEECEIDGYVIPAKTRVIVNAWAIGRTSWAQGETFRPDRFLNGDNLGYKGTDFGFLTFGAGRRVCPGITYALANIQLPLAQLLFHFDWRMPDGLGPQDLDMTEAFGLAVQRKNNLHLVSVPHTHSSR